MAVVPGDPKAAPSLHTAAAPVLGPNNVPSGLPDGGHQSWEGNSCGGGDLWDSPKIGLWSGSGRLQLDAKWRVLVG